MRLERIKLSGFKSFVDPTALPLPGNLVGVVGPNGCGKSNIIDAVRWVMGESSAKHLRGDTMADVVFNGSSTRKPVGIASVELLFDNSEGSAAGEYAGYQKIAIKRQVGRDGQSSYHLNGTRCRRKDITDLFLGTGLGSRSYAIIEQGTISRLIEAKPDELREIIEEAAGISRYKERRHETEIRMRHTRENLERLDDLHGELGKQVESLQRQVKKAERYLALRDQERHAKVTLLNLRGRRTKTAMTALSLELDELGDALRVALSAAREASEAEAESQAARERQQSEMQGIQAQFYELGADVGRAQDALRQAEKSREESDRDLVLLDAEAARAAEELANDSLQLAEIRRERVEVETLIEQRRPLLDQAMEAFKAAERAVHDARESVQAAQTRFVSATSRSEALATQERQLNEVLSQVEVRLRRIEAEATDLASDDSSALVDQLSVEVTAEESRVSSVEERIEALGGEMSAGARDLEELRQELNVLRAEVHTAQGRLSSLELLQQHAMGKDRTAVNDWLSWVSDAQPPRLAESLDVRAGWESAVENVLGPYVEAFCVRDAGPYLSALDRLPEREALTFLENRVEDRTSLRELGPKPLPRLTEQVASLWNVDSLLCGIFCAPNLDAARAAREWLEDHESVVTLRGERVGRDWTALQFSDNARSGVIQRERELRELATELGELREQEQSCLARIQEKETRLAETQQDRVLAEGERRAAEQNVLALRSRLHQASARQQQVLKRLDTIRVELAEIELQRHEMSQRADSVRASLADMQACIAHETSQRESLDAQRRSTEVGLAQAERDLRAEQETLQRHESRRDALRSSESLTQSHLERAEKHALDAGMRLQQLQQRREALLPIEHERLRLEQLQRDRERVERELAAQRRKLAELETAARTASGRKIEAEAEIERIKSRVERVRIDLEGHQVREEALSEQLAELGVTPDSELLTGGPEEAGGMIDESELQETISRLGQEIERLGPVNLLAVEEFGEQKGRLDVLEQQRSDLRESLDALTEAIEKIDRECRALFKGTFDRINQGFQTMFPKLFGGGHATLELTERDLLESGVTVIARPPGKRNSSIHLLSGGEKALTAVALVFAIFELNPAPFCLLDEVDAPLDDANVGRFCGLVKEMSERVQFLFITHNKVTMEIAEYLAGITMREPGVSRIVAVDLEAAVELASS